MSKTKEHPYLKEVITKVELSYNPNYGDNRLCKCGHEYYKHFIDYEPCVCEDCGCNFFEEK